MDKRKRKIIQKKGKHYSEMERHGIIREMLKNNWTKQFAWELYTGEPQERGQLMRWMRKLGYMKEIKHKKFTFDVKSEGMKKHQEQEKSETEPFEVFAIEKTSCLIGELINS